jgi:hypothetical protein
LAFPPAFAAAEYPYWAARSTPLRVDWPWALKCRKRRTIVTP